MYITPSAIMEYSNIQRSASTAVSVANLNLVIEAVPRGLYQLMLRIRLHLSTRTCLPELLHKQDPTWGTREQGEEAKYIHEKEQAQLAALREEQKTRSTASNDNTTKDTASSTKDRDFECGFGGQEDLEDRYATTSGEH
ncbi:hypothetical protein BDR05DRAFT_521383 [Suillus weaverae]|nr:hypothetical protein BDR05DRAFT_521383 [Suillus weaverae]